MTIHFRVSSFICLLAAFIWQIGTETQWAVGSHAEEEEKKLNIVFGNLSLKSTTLPPSEDGATTKPPPVEEASVEDGLSLTDPQRTWKADSNLTEYDDLRGDGNKNDASPENSVDRESSDTNNGFYKENSKDEASSLVDSEKESSVDFGMTLLSSLTTASYPVTSEEDSLQFSDSSCSEGDPECKSKSYIPTEHFVSPRLEDKESFTTSGFSSPTPLWNIVKSMKRLDPPTQAPSITFTPFKTSVDSEEFLTSSTTTAQTSENLIPVEASAINKADTVMDVLVNKTEKSKATKPADNITPTEDRSMRTVIKVVSSTPATTATKADDLHENSEASTLISKMIEAMSVTTPLPTDSYYVLSTNVEFHYPDAVPHASPKYDFTEKEALSPSSIPRHSGLPTEINKPFVPLFTTVSWYNAKSGVPPDEGETEIPPRLLPSFRASSPSTERSGGTQTTSSFQEVGPLSSHVTTRSLPHLLVSTLQPHLNSPFVVKDTTPVITPEKEFIPPPRLTNPGCSSLPVCIEITLLDTTWDEFCPQAREFQEFLSKVVSHILQPIHPHQVVLEAENCVQNPPVYLAQSSPDVTVALFVTDDSGEYAEKLTDVCAHILRKWAPTTFRNSVIEVRLFNSELQSTSLPAIPELNSGFVAAVSISAVAGVALCMLCILLVVMKQKLLQSRNSDTTSPAADAYSLDSLSINASFRRRRNRRSARSYLNHAFSDQEIPSHPLNEKSLQNCLKNRELLEEEFKKIPMNMPKLDQIPEGAHVKNRYSNILPRPETRVVLADPSGDPLKCYINANYIKGYGGKPSTYIACQAPLPEGIEDFWRMVWEQQCRVIIMLTMFEENGISRCAAYFPQSTLVAHPPYGDFQVSLLKKDVYEFYTMSTFRLLDLEKNLFRDVVHLWYTNWPDVGVPKDPSSLITFVQQCRSFINCNAGPTVVHCSTGTGRTGVFVALDISMREYDESRSIDILQCVSQLRRDRGGAVQNKDQYILTHEAMLEYISGMANQSQRSSMHS